MHQRAGFSATITQRVKEVAGLRPDHVVVNTVEAGESHSNVGCIQVGPLTSLSSSSISLSLSFSFISFDDDFKKRNKEKERGVGEKDGPVRPSPKARPRPGLFSFPRSSLSLLI